MDCGLGGVAGKSRVRGPSDFRILWVWGRASEGLGLIPLPRQAALVSSSLKEEWASWQIVVGISDFQAEVGS